MASVAQLGRPLAQVSGNDRVTYLKRVMLWTTGGLTFTGIVGSVTAGLIYFLAASGVTAVLSPWFSLIAILGSFGLAQYVAPRFVFGDQKVFGFLMACFFQGIAFGWLLLTAVLVGAQSGSPLGLVGTALVLTAATGAGMTAYVWSSPKDFRMLGAALSALTLPMLLLMGFSFIAPAIAPGLLGGWVGIGLTAVFVVISAAGLLYQINAVLHQLSTEQHIEGSYLITMGVLVLYWNILTLLINLSRD